MENAGLHFITPPANGFADNMPVSFELFGLRHNLTVEV